MMNTFSLILVLGTVITGLAYAYDYFKLRPVRLKTLEEALKLNPNLSIKEQRRIKDGTSAFAQFASLFPIVLFVFLFRAFIYEPFRIPSGSMEPTLLPGDFIAVSKWSYGIRNPLTNEVWVETSTPDYGDVVVFKYPEDTRIDYIKRVVGLPGDEVIFENKRIYIRKACQKDSSTPCASPQAVKVVPVGTVKEKGLSYEETYEVYDETLGNTTHKMQINPRVPDLSQYYYRQKGAMRGSWIVPEGHYFVMGDNRDNSKDSRFWGFVPHEYLVGKTVAIWLSLEFNRSQDDWIPSFIPSAIRFERLGGID